MSYKIVWSGRALKELSDAWAWYEDRSEGLGDRFQDAVFKKIAQIENDPIKEILRKSPYRESIIKVFPYLIIFRVAKNKEIFIHSIFHMGRNPKKKYSKL